MNQNKPVPARAGQGDEEEGQGEARGEGRRIGRGEKETNKPASTRINTFKSNHDIGLHRRNGAYTRTIVGDSFSLSFSLSPLLFTLACLASNCKYTAEQKRALRIAEVALYVASCSRSCAK